MSKNTKKENVNWMKIKWIRATKNNKKVLYYKNSFKDEHFHEINIGNQFDTSSSNGVIANRKFQDVLPIDLAKKNDLVKLCNDRIIPVDYHSFYKHLKTVSKKTDFVDFSDSDEE